MNFLISHSIDICIVGVLGVCFFLGFRRGLLRSFLSLLVIFLAIFCGGFLLQQFASPLSDSMQLGIVEKFDAHISDSDSDADSSAPASTEETSEELSDVVQSTQEEDTAILGGLVSETMAKLVLFSIGFFGFIVICVGISKFFKLASFFEFLSPIDKVLGGVMGLMLGYVFLYLLYWLLHIQIQCIPPDLLDGSCLLRWLINQPLRFFGEWIPQLTPTALTT